MKSEVIVLLALVASAFALVNPIYGEWEMWKARYNPKYATNAEHEMRFRVFQQNHRRVLQLNAEYAGRAKFTLGKFADLSPEEFSEMYLSKIPKDLSYTHASFRHNDFPSKKDWREDGVVPPVRDQSSGSVFPYVALDNLESVYAIHHGNILPSLSLQQILDCAHEAQLVPDVLDYAYKNSMESEDDYPFTGDVGKCKFDSSKATYKFVGVFKVKPDEDSMVSALNTVGPLTIGVDASKWQFYSSGIFNLDCSTQLNHAALIVGYDSTTIGGKEVKYWIIKNSWGEMWGEKGYIRLVRGQDECGVNDYVYTILA